jgi:hypothetical protein
MACAMFFAARCGKEQGGGRHYVVAISVFICGIGIFAIRHLPPIDFLPYKIGTNLIEARDGQTQSAEVETTLIYRDRQTDRIQEFTLADTTWYDTVRWEYIDTRIAFDGKQTATAEFNIFTSDGDLTDSLLFAEQPVTLLCVTELDRIVPRCRERLARVATEAVEMGDNVLCITTTPIDDSTCLTLDARSYPCANIDGTLLKSLLRARVGVVRIDHGVIVEKSSCTDL